MASDRLLEADRCNTYIVLDVGDIEIVQSKTGKILFSVTPAGAAVSIDGKAGITIRRSPRTA